MKSYLIGRKGMRLTQNLVSLLCGLVKRVHHKMEIGRQRAHAGNLVFLGSCFTFIKNIIKINIEGKNQNGKDNDQRAQQG
jgi:hypothetical protein